MERPIPRDTRAAAGDGLGANPSLAWDKLLHPGGPGDDAECKVMVPEEGLPGASAPETNAVLRRRRTFLENGAARGLKVSRFDATVESRMVVGFGAEHVTEVNIRLDRLRGFAIVPGSACKGLARTHATLEIAASLGIHAADPGVWTPQHPGGRLPQTPLRLLAALLEAPVDDQFTDALVALQRVVEGVPDTEEGWLARRDVAAFRTVFGGRDGCGKVTFLDGCPVSGAGLVVDIVNPHFGAYYSDPTGHALPDDKGRPIPNRFLTVPGGAVFSFGLTSRDPVALAAADGWLRRGLRDLGIGAKTAAGYGIMRVPEP
jgi:CRISPR type III-B/RAMP module RAMP protein Cmr6